MRRFRGDGRNRFFFKSGCLPLSIIGLQIDDNIGINNYEVQICRQSNEQRR
ncbi:hypothetical protein Hdeb2414_s0014g00430491 [Helianthus debilis subsp. tardiflorus]